MPAGSVWKKAPTRERTRCIPCAKRFARAAVAPTHVEHVERRRSDAEVACVVPVKGLNLFYFLGTIVSGLGTHNSNTSGRTNPTGRARSINGSARAETKVQTANRVWQRCKRRSRSRVQSTADTATQKEPTCVTMRCVTFNNTSGPSRRPRARSTYPHGSGGCPHMSEVEVEVTSSITRWRRAAERVTARERWPARPSSPASAVSYNL